MAAWAQHDPPETTAERARRLEAAGDLPAALAAYEAALAESPDGEAEALLCGLARIAGRLAMPEQALLLWEEVARRAPASLEAVDGRARALAALGRHGEAAEALKAAVLAHPHEARLWTVLGVVVNETGDSEAAHALLDEAVRLEPGLAAALHNRGDVRFDLGRLAEAEADFDAAARHAASPQDTAVIAYARALLHLHRGELRQGWAAYAVRLDPDHPDAPVFEAPGARWTPEAPLEGRHLLAVAEQGIGDEIMFAGLLPDLLEALGPRGLLSVALDPRLEPLVRRSFPQVGLASHGTERRGGRAHRSVRGTWERPPDLWTPLGALPGRFRLSPDSFPRRAYLRPDPGRVAHWRRWLGGGPAVGLSWRSGLGTGRRRRALPELAAFAPLLGRPGVRFVNLQYGALPAELDALDGLAAAPLLRPPFDLKTDLDELAALCVALDVTLSIPNATAALAGACGAETWFLDPPNAWPRLGTETWPWYARARSFEAARFHDWADVMARVAGALEARLSSGAGG